MEGVRKLLVGVINELYKKEIRVLHRPLDFFKEIGISIDEILQKHESVKKIRAPEWAKENSSNPNKYNLFFAQSQRGIVAIKQVLDFGVHRWGVPLCVPFLLEKDHQKKQRESVEPLVEYLEEFQSAEEMSQQIKDNERYGIGSAIGDKASHLFVKMYIHYFNLATKKSNDWGILSYEMPFDSNVGRVLFRSGILLEWISMKDLIKYDVVQKGKGKGGKHHIRVTNLRGKKSDIMTHNKKFFENYKTIVTEYLKTQVRPQTVQIQQIPNVLLLDTEYGIGDIDDGIMYIGTNYCLNHENPECDKCPICSECVGFVKERKLITEYRT
ncbi:MAG: hypothetical protein AB1633_09400 [Elusimicrobiota bacterium]